MTPISPSEEMLHAYVDGRLDAGDRQAVEAFLARSPDWARTVAGWKADAERLRAECAGAMLLPPNPRLEPAVLRRGLQARMRRRAALAASLLLTAGLGGVLGWQARNLSLAAARPQPMADAVQAYRVFAMARPHPPEVGALTPTGMHAWLSQALGRATVLPDLGAHGFRLLGAQLVPTDAGAAAVVIYEGEDSRRIAFYIRPGGPFPTEQGGTRRDGALLTQYWFRDGYRFALVGRADDPNSAEIVWTLRSTV